MKGIIRWMQVNQDTNEFLYDIAQQDFDTDRQDVREQVYELLGGDWDTFGEPGDCILVVGEEDEDEEDDT